MTSPQPNVLQSIVGPTPLASLSEAQVAALQTALEELGYGVDIDGVLGPITSGAWARFKSDNGLNEPDTIGPSSAALLLSRSARVVSTPIPGPALAIVKSFEGYSANAYDDTMGVMTIGYGTTKYPDGSPVKSGDTVTIDQAIAYLQHDLTATQVTLSTSVPYWVNMNTDQESALISFGYNLGAGFYGSADFGTISAALRDHRWSDIPSIMPMYSNPDDPNVHPGLLRRRIAEADLWQGNGPFAHDSNPPAA